MSARRPRAQLKYANPVTAQRNFIGLNFVRGVLFCFGAIGAGVVGLTGLNGLYAYALLHVLATVCLLFLMNWKPSVYIQNGSIVSFCFTGVADNAALYIFFWTLSYALVHIY